LRKENLGMMTDRHVRMLMKMINEERTSAAAEAKAGTKRRQENGGITA